MQQLLEQGLRTVQEWGKGLRMFAFDRLSKDVDAGLYAATIRGILLHHIYVEKRVVTYGKLATATAGLPKGGQLAQALQKIAEDDFQAKRPLSTAIVVNEHTGLPGAGFFKQARELGLEVGPDGESELTFWREVLKNLGDVKPLSEGPLGILFKAAAAQGKTLDKDGEMGVLEGLWDAFRMALPNETDGWKSLPIPPSISQSQDVSGVTIDTSSVPSKKSQEDDQGPVVVVPRDTRPLDEVVKDITAKQGFILIPPRDLKVGDVVLNVVENEEVVVDKIATKVKTITIPSNRGAQDREVHWSGGGVDYISPCVGFHFKVRRADSVLPKGRSDVLKAARKQASGSPVLASRSQHQKRKKS